MHHLDAVREALWVLNQVAEHRGDEPIALDTDLPDDDPDEVVIEKISDVMANLLHLAVEAGADPYWMTDRAHSTYEGDAEDADATTHVPNVEAFHGSPAVLTPGTVLTPGPAVHHVFACDELERARDWGKKKAGTGEHHVYRVRMSDDAFTSAGHILACSATVIEEVSTGDDIVTSPPEPTVYVRWERTEAFEAHVPASDWEEDSDVDFLGDYEDDEHFLGCTDRSVLEFTEPQEASA